MIGNRRDLFRTAAVSSGLVGAFDLPQWTPLAGEVEAPADGEHAVVSLPGAPALHDPYQAVGATGDLRWWKGQLHTHTARSFDGDPAVPPARRVTLYQGAEYDFVVLTDHDRVSTAPSVPPGSGGGASAGSSRPFLTVPGVESTHPSGHLGVWFLGERAAPAVIDPPLVPSSRPPAERIEAWAASGALVCCNHPSHSSSPLSADQVASWAGGNVPFRFLEVFNTLANRAPRDLAHNLEVWHRAITAAGPEHPIWGVAADDSHGQPVGRSWIAVAAPSLKSDTLRAALLAGRFYASNGPAFSVLGVDHEFAGITASAPGVDVVRFIGDDGSVVDEVAGEHGTYRPHSGLRWVRVEATDAAGRTAWSQPFWLEA
jgi:hypothetical protein